jgi:hypothetical protein
MDQSDFSNFEKNLISFLRLFQNRPFHLTKYLLENMAFNEDFIEKISNSEKLNKLSEKYELEEMPNIYFLNFKDMFKFFENISNEYTLEDFDGQNSIDEINEKLDELIKREKYEEAIRVRDYMIQNNIKRKN